MQQIFLNKETFVAFLNIRLSDGGLHGLQKRLFYLNTNRKANKNLPAYAGVK